MCPKVQYHSFEIQLHFITADSRQFSFTICILCSNYQALFLLHLILTPNRRLKTRTV